MNKNSTRHLLCGLLASQLLWGAASALFAQPVPSKLPGSTHIFPAGGKIGSSLKVRVGAECIPPGTRFQLSDPRVIAPALLQEGLQLTGAKSARRIPNEIPITYPKEWSSQLNIPEDIEPGVIYWKISCAETSCAL